MLYNIDELEKLFDSKKEKYDLLTSEVVSLLKKLLESENIKFSKITSRVKEKSSFIEKVSRKKYKDPFSEITDFAGIRLVYVYIDDLEKIRTIIESNFEVDLKKSVNKSIGKEPDRFGYEGIHYIVSLKNTSKTNLKDLVCEIQIKTICQDTWSIVQHNLLYKREDEFPDYLKKDLYAISANLYLVDKTFNNIKNEKENYEKKLEERRTILLKKNLDRDSLLEYLNEILREENLPIGDKNLFYVIYEYLIDKNKYKNIKDIDDLVKISKKDREYFYSKLPQNEAQSLERTITSELYLIFYLKDSGFKDKIKNSTSNSIFTSLLSKLNIVKFCTSIE